MYDQEARRVIEALRSGVPSKAVGMYFTEARPQMMKLMSDSIEEVVQNDGLVKGLVVTGKYGEGKTHLLNTVFNMAHSSNMVVSLLSISKETPFDKMFLVYQKLMANTYLPGREQPGFLHLLDEMSPNSPAASELLLYASKELQTDKLYYVLRSLLSTEDEEEKFMLKADLAGDFMSNASVRKIYRRIFNATVKFNANFSKTKHAMDYFSFMSRLFLKLGFNGWVILFDEAELIGRLGKKARLGAYRNMAYFLAPDLVNRQIAKREKKAASAETGASVPLLEKSHMESVLTVFALSASYEEDVIEGKHDLENLAQIYPDYPEPMQTVIERLKDAPQLQPLTKQEIANVVAQIQEFHGRAYDWHPDVDTGAILQATANAGFLLRTKLRCAIELLDQLYQYREAGEIRIGELGGETYEEDVPSLDRLEEAMPGE